MKKKVDELNTTVFGDSLKPGSFSISKDQNGNINEPTLKGNRAKKIIFFGETMARKYDTHMVDLTCDYWRYLKLSFDICGKVNYCNIAEEHNCMDSCRKIPHHLWDECQVYFDKLSISFMIRYGSSFNYLHIMQSGHFVEIAKSVDAVGDYNLQALERMQGLDSLFYQRKTQKEGGPKKKSFNFEIIKSQIRKVALICFNFSEETEKTFKFKKKRKQKKLTEEEEEELQCVEEIIKEIESVDNHELEELQILFN